MSDGDGLQNDIDEIIRRVTDGGGGSRLAAAEIVRYLYINATAVTKPHLHVWDILGVRNPPAPRVPVHPRMTDYPTHITIVLIRCQECNFPQTIELDGLWTESQIKANLDEPINK